MNMGVHDTDQESKRGVSNFLDETICLIVVFKIDLFFVLSKEELPNNSTSENLEWFRFKISLSMFQILFMRINISPEKRGQEVVSSCLNTSWSRRWLKPNLNLVSNFIPSRSWQLQMLFGDGRINFNTLFLKIEKLSEFLILLYRLSYSVTRDGKYEFLKKKICVTLNWGILSMFLALYVLLTMRILLTRYLGDWFLMSLKKAKFPIPLPLL